ncbi:MAG: hypothetical protein ACLR3R_08640 [Clostridium paraputrificum]
MAAYEKQTWVDGETITKSKLDHIEEGIASIELTPGTNRTKRRKRRNRTCRSSWTKR